MFVAGGGEVSEEEARAFAEREFGAVTPGAGCMWDEPDCPLSQIFIDDMHRIDSVLGPAGEIAVPWLLVHGTDDGLIPIAQAETLLEAAERGQMLRYPCGHGDCPADWDRFWRDMANFLRTNDLVAG